MAIDSSADLLFRISADSADAENNIVRFRNLLGKNLGDIKKEFTGWAENTFGALDTAQAKWMAGGAALAAGLVAAGAAAKHAAEQYAAYVGEVDRGSKMTGIAAEQMSVLKLAADHTFTSYDALVRGLTMFERQVMAANAGGKQQLEMFDRLGISREQLAAGERNILPLLGDVSERFRNLASGTERAGMAREMFSRGGTELLTFLRLGKEGLKEFADEAHRAGLIITAEDVVALKQYKLAAEAAQSQQEALDVQIGRVTLPVLSSFRTAWAAVIKTLAQGRIGTPWELIGGLAENFFRTKQEAESLAQTLSKLGGTGALGAPAADAAAKTKEQWRGLSNILDEVRGKLADAAGEEQKIQFDMARTGAEAARQMEDLARKQREGTLEPGVAQREMAAWRELMRLLPGLQDQLIGEIDRKRREGIDRAQTEYAQAEVAAMVRGFAAQRQASQELQALLRREQENTLEDRKRQIDEEIELMRQGYREQGVLKPEIETALEALRQARIEREERQAQVAYQSEMAQLQGQLQRIEQAHQTSEERISARYAADLARFNAAEETKAQKAATSEAQRAEIAMMYAAIRAGLLAKEAADMQALRNSQGWQGVLGAPFAAMIRQDEALSREWATSTNQSLMLVRVSMEGLRETGQRAFGSFAQGMGSNIANALVYRKSVGEAMRAAAAATLESLAAESLTYAIYSTALGFLRLAQHDYAGAGQAFTSAAIWGSVGAAAAIAGRAIAPAQGGQAGAAGGGEGSAGGGAAGGASAGSEAQRGPNVTIYVQGHLVGWTHIGELTDAITDHVVNSDGRLVASQSKNSRPVVRG